MDKISSFDLLNREPIKFYDILIYKPKLSDIEIVGKDSFMRRTNLITISELDIRDFYEEIGENIKDIDPFYFKPYNYLISQCQNKLFFLEIKIAFFTYIKREIKIEEGLFTCSLDNGSTFVFTQEIFNEFQNIVKEINFEKGDEEFPEIISDNEEMVKKFEEKRQLLIETKRKERKKAMSKEEGITLGEVISCLCAFGIGYNMLNIWDLTIYQLYDQFERCKLKDEYDKNLSAIMAGADSSKIDLVYWIKKINNN